jgi:hypothetical protein
VVYQSLTEMATRRYVCLQNIAQPVREANNLTDCLDTMGSSTLHKPAGLHGLLRGQAMDASGYVGTVVATFAWQVRPSGET